MAKEKSVNNKKVNTEKVTMPEEKSKIGKSGQNLGVVMMVLAFVLAAVSVHIAGEDFFMESILMTVIMAVSVILSTVGYLTVAIVLAAASVVVYTGYKIFSMSVNSGELSPIIFVWILLPALAIGGVALFVRGYSELLLDNALLQKQISELVMIDKVTGLYNLRSMFMDIQTQISYSERNDTPISLMILRLRYPTEMKRVLKNKEFDMVIKQLGLLLSDTVRMEDKVYRIDGDGGFGIILTCDRDGTKIVEKRLRAKLLEPKWFEDITSKNQLRVEVKIGCLQYDKSKYNRDANSFKESVEEEVAYDI